MNNDLINIKHLLSNEIIRIILTKEKLLVVNSITYFNTNLYLSSISTVKSKNKRITNLIIIYNLRNLAFKSEITVEYQYNQFIKFSNKYFSFVIKTNSRMFYRT